jgi:isochorismate hydrolase
MSKHRTANHRFAPKGSALLVIDMQALFLDRSSHSYLPDAEDIIGNVQNLIDAYRKRSLPIVFTRHATKESESAGAMGRWWGDVVRDGDKAGEIDPRFAPDKGEKVVRKTRYSAFVGTDLLQHLYAESVSSLVITGVMTHLCCESTARDAFMRDFDVFLVVDGTASKTEDLHVSSIKTLTDGFAIPVTTSEVIRWLKAK